MHRRRLGLSMGGRGWGRNFLSILILFLIFNFIGIFIIFTYSVDLDKKRIKKAICVRGKDVVGRECHLLSSSL